MAPESIPDRPPLPDKFAPPPDCEIPWQPNALAPVFYGYEDMGPVAGVLTHMRVLFPTLDGTPQHAQILAHCGAFPLIVITHGACPVAQMEHYKHWGSSRVATQLAQAGYIVAVPQLSGGIYGTGDYNRVHGIVDWLRGSWEHGDLVASSLGAIGHSWGSNVAGFLATDGGADAYAGLSEVWNLLPATITVPQLHMFGGGDDSPTSDNFDQLPPPKHRVRIAGAKHYDYLPGSPCQSHSGPCVCTPEIAADVVTMFFGRYLPPPAVPDLPQHIPPTLVPPPLSLAVEQEFYAGGYLGAFSCLPSDPAHCSVTLSFDTGTWSATETLP